jgi:hypothetical protein
MLHVAQIVVLFAVEMVSWILQKSVMTETDCRMMVVIVTVA